MFAQLLTQWRAMLHLAWPILVAQLSMTAMNFVDATMAGNYGEIDLAAIAIGGSIWLPSSLAAQAILLSVTAICAQHWGAKNYQQAGQTLQQGIWLGLFSSIIVAIAVYIFCQFLAVFKLAPEMMAITQQYMLFLCFAYPAASIYQALRSFIEATGRTRPIMVANIIGLLANIPLNYIFIYGKLGLPALGGAGCGLATTLCFYIMMFGLGIYLFSSDLKALVFKHWQAPNKQQWQLIKIGLPISFSIFVEVSIFTAIALIIAPLGVVEVAGHQVALSFTSQTFMLPLSLSMALTIHIGHLLGAEQFKTAKFASNAGIILSLIIAAITCSFILATHQYIPLLYTQDALIIALASQLFLLAAVYQFSDSVQVCCIGILRAYKITARPFIIVVISFWLIALPVGYSLSLTDFWLPAMGAKGMWIALIIGLSIAAVLLLSLLFYINQKAPKLYSNHHV